MRRSLPLRGALLTLLAAATAHAAPGDAAAPDPVELSAPAGRTVTLHLALRPPAGVLFNRKGPSRVRVTTPFGTVERPLPRGTPWPEDPGTYDVQVPPVALPIAVPAGTPAGSHRIEVRTELFLCDGARHACYRTRPEASALLRVGPAVQDATLVVEPPPLGAPAVPRPAVR